MMQSSANQLKQQQAADTQSTLIAYNNRPIQMMQFKQDSNFQKSYNKIQVIIKYILKTQVMIKYSY